MTVPAAPPHPPLDLVDLDSARADWDRIMSRGRRWGMALWVPVAGVLMVNAFVFFDGGRGGVLAAVVLGAVYLLPSGAGGVYDRWWNRRRGGPAAPGPSSLTRVHCHASGPELWAAVRAAFDEMGFVGAIPIDGHTLQSVRQSTFSSPRLLTVRVQEASAHGALVTVWARPQAAWWSANGDLGRSRRDANAVLGALPGGHTPVRGPECGSQA